MEGVCTVPVTGQVFCQVARSGAADIDLALDAAHKVRHQWANTPPAERSAVLLRIADRIIVLRDGAMVAECDASQIDQPGLIQLASGTNSIGIAA